MKTGRTKREEKCELSGERGGGNKIRARGCWVEEKDFASKYPLTQKGKEGTKQRSREGGRT